MAKQTSRLSKAYRLRIVSQHSVTQNLLTKSKIFYSHREYLCSKQRKRVRVLPHLEIRRRRNVRVITRIYRVSGAPSHKRWRYARVTTRTTACASGNNASIEFGCSLTLE